MRTHLRCGWRRWARALLLALSVVSLMPLAHAHKASDAYLVLADAPAANTPGAIGLQLSLALKDLDAAIDTLDADHDRQLRWAEVQAALPAIARWVGEGVALHCADRALAAAWHMQSLERRSDGVYLRLAASFVCAPAAALALDYQLMKGIDPTHRLLVNGTLQGQVVVAVLAPQPGRSGIALRAAASADAQRDQGGLATLANFFAEGVHHIVTGYDHLAFLLALLLPISLRARSGAASAARQGQGPVRRPGLAALVRTVTGFTIGHSCTLILASLGLISASPRWVEPAIAITIAISAALNLYPLRWLRWLRGDALALGFGLIHGLGFSGVMAEAGVTGPLLVWALAGFNLGVEAGQLACVLVWCAVHLLLVRWPRYNQVVVRGGSWALVALALYWAMERITG